jgi:hypothetical protein
MLKKLTGLFILLLFLLVKSTSLFAVDAHKKSMIIYHAEQNTDETPDAEKETKQLEIADEDFINQAVTGPVSLILSKKQVHIVVQRITAPYISLPYPPPNAGL